MRPVFLLPLALAAVGVAGCGPTAEGTEQAALRVPQRDLTLQQAPAPKAEVASPVELAGRSSDGPAAHRPKRARRPAPVRPPEATQPDAAPATAAPALAAPEPVLAVVSAAPAPVNPRELAPGETVTVIPASSGPSTGRDWTDEPRSSGGRAIVVGLGGRGGGCKPRGTVGNPIGARGRAGGGWR